MEADIGDDEVVVAQHPHDTPVAVDHGRPADAALLHRLGRALHLVLGPEGEDVGGHHFSDEGVPGH